MTDSRLESCRSWLTGWLALYIRFSLKLHPIDSRNRVQPAANWPHQDQEVSTVLQMQRSVYSSVCTAENIGGPAFAMFPQMEPRPQSRKLHLVDDDRSIDRSMMRFGRERNRRRRGIETTRNRSKSDRMYEHIVVWMDAKRDAFMTKQTECYHYRCTLSRFENTWALLDCWRFGVCVYDRDKTQSRTPEKVYVERIRRTAEISQPDCCCTRFYVHR